MSQEGFWEHQEQSNKVMQELKGLKNIVEPFAECVKRVNDSKEFIALAENDEDLKKQLADEAALLKIQIDALELQAHLSGPFDNANALLSINESYGTIVDRVRAASVFGPADYVSTRSLGANFFASRR